MKARRTKPRLKFKATDMVKSLAALIANEGLSRQRLDRLEAITRNLSLYGWPTCETCETALTKSRGEDGRPRIDPCPKCDNAAAAVDGGEDAH